SSDVFAFCRAPAFCTIALYFSGGYFSVPRNITCSKKWAKPDLPGSISFREPVCIVVKTETTFGNPVGTMMTFRPFGSVFSVAANGRMGALLFVAGALFFFGAAANAAGTMSAQAN